MRDAHYTNSHCRWHYYLMVSLDDVGEVIPEHSPPPDKSRGAQMTHTPFTLLTGVILDCQLVPLAFPLVIVTWDVVLLPKDKRSGVDSLHLGKIALLKCSVGNKGS